MGEKNQEGTWAKVAKNFLAAGVISIITFVCWLIPVVMQFTTFNYGSINGMSVSNLLTNISIFLPAIIGIVQTGLLFYGWKQIQEFFGNKTTKPSFQLNGVESTGRILWAMKLSAVGYGLIVTSRIWYFIAFYLSIYSNFGTLLEVIGFILSFAGFINQCVGMGQTASAFERFPLHPPTSVVPMIEKQYVPPQSQPQVQQQIQQQPQYTIKSQTTMPTYVAPSKIKFCPGCGSELPQSPDLKFCPMCGSSILLRN
ncbi:MAG: hypothetical protein RBG13Loki_1365 [Promethearchaeota archaeon CR_4]|nr:MAG: hypothetical protein RBG13Loki_1365 [Candidatus Lokiarchaeota archaeon CR_4]